MKVILNKDVYNLGEEGDVREVAPGYAQNYLIPNSMVVLFTKANIAMFEGRRAAIEKRKEEKRQNALSLKEKIESLELVISMPSGKSGKLFGSVTNATIVENLEKQGIKIERKKIDIPGHTVKSTGPVSVKIKLYESDVAELKVVIKGEGVEEEAPAKKKAAPKATKKKEPAVAEVEAAVEEPAAAEKEAPAKKKAARKATKKKEPAVAEVEAAVEEPAAAEKEAPAKKKAAPKATKKKEAAAVEEKAPAKKKAAPKVTKKEEPATAEVETAVKERAVPTEAEVKNEDNPT